MFFLNELDRNIYSWINSANFVQQLDTLEKQRKILSLNASSVDQLLNALSLQTWKQMIQINIGIIKFALLNW